jgi:hypothetical protein
LVPSQTFPLAIDMTAWLAEHYPESRPETHRLGVRWMLKECPFDSTHDSCASVLLDDEGTASFRCWHRSCAKFDMTDLLALHGGDLAWDFARSRHRD